MGCSSFARRWIPDGSSKAVRRFLRVAPFVLLGLAIFGFILFVAAASVAFAAYDDSFQYSSPLTVMWTGIITVVSATPVALWWIFFPRESSRAGHTLSVVINAVYTLCALVAAISYSASPNEALAVFLSFFLWMSSSSIAMVSSLLWLRAQKKIPTSQNIISAESDPLINSSIGSGGPKFFSTSLPLSSSMDAPRKPCCHRGRLYKWYRFFAVFFGALLLICLAPFCVGVAIQAAATADEYRKFPAPGTLWTMSVESETRPNVTYNMEMHLWCRGGGGQKKKIGSSSSSSSSSTLLFEHAEGLNSASGVALSNEWVARGRRVCLYDRLGYGWTPSLFTRSQYLHPTTGDILAHLLQTASETGPFTCVGHSTAGSAVCMEFALSMPKNAVTGIAMLDGYPDLLNPWTKCPSKDTSNNGGATSYLSQLVDYAIVTGPTAFARTFVGQVGPNFVPSDYAGAFQALRRQTRFFLAQYFDVSGFIQDGVKSYLYSRINGASRDPSTGLIQYGEGLASMGVKHVLHVPSASRMNATTCQDNDMFLAQAQLYATTLAPSGQVVIAPEGSDHSFPFTAPYATWVADLIAKTFH